MTQITSILAPIGAGALLGSAFLACLPWLLPPRQSSGRPDLVDAVITCNQRPPDWESAQCKKIREMFAAETSRQQSANDAMDRAVVAKVLGAHP